MSVKPNKNWKVRLSSYKPQGIKTTGTPSAAEILKDDKNFLKECEQRGIKPSVRKARDWRRKLGSFAGKIVSKENA